MTKRLTIAILATVILVTAAFSSAAFAQEDIQVQIKGKLILFDAKPIMGNDRVLIPIRGAFEQIGGIVTWDAQNRKVLIEKDTMTIELTIDADIALIHRKYDFSGIPQQVKLDETAKIIGDRAYAPVRFVAETLGMEVSWEESTNTVIIDDPVSVINPVESPVSYKKITSEDIKDRAVVIEWYNHNRQTKGIYFMTDKDATYILVSSGAKPTGGYGIEITSATMVAKGSIYLTAQVNGPTPEMMVTQAITYPHVLLQVDGTGVTIVDGEIMDGSASAGRSKGPLSEQGKGIKATDITAIELFDLDGKLVKAIDKQQFEKIVEAYNEGIPTDDPAVMMIAGHGMKITLTNGTVIYFTSYGSKTHVIATVSGKDVSEGYHLICPVIAEILLSNPADL